MRIRDESHNTKVGPRAKNQGHSSRCQSLVSRKGVLFLLLLSIYTFLFYILLFCLCIITWVKYVVDLFDVSVELSLTELIVSTIC